tara:strand:- start:789 stop:1418 length:630 start_codon:yes stop_codon:yes gene_type:complete
MKNVEAVIAQKYNFRFSKYGAVPEASLWFSQDRQFMRFKLIADVLDQAIKGSSFSISDIGCGYGALLPYLKKRFPNSEFTYNGFDIAEKPLNFCKKNYKWPNVFYRTGNLPDRYSDFCVMSGTYNYAPVLSPKQWQDYLFENLTQIWKFTRLSMIFNLSVADEARITNQNISYFNKDNVKNFCKNNLGRTNLFLSEKLPKEVTFNISKV